MPSASSNKINLESNVVIIVYIKLSIVYSTVPVLVPKLCLHTNTIIHLVVPQHIDRSYNIKARKLSFHSIRINIDTNLYERFRYLPLQIMTQMLMIEEVWNVLWLSPVIYLHPCYTASSAHKTIPCTLSSNPSVLHVVL